MCLEEKTKYAQIIDLPCEDERVRRYLKGETLDVDDLTERKAKGWYLVCVDGFPTWMGEGIQWYIEEQISTGMEAVLR